MRISFFIGEDHQSHRKGVVHNKFNTSARQIRRSKYKDNAYSKQIGGVFLYLDPACTCSVYQKCLKQNKISVFQNAATSEFSTDFDDLLKKSENKIYQTIN